MVLVSDVSLDIEAGTWCTIIGPNGAGKTSLVETWPDFERLERIGAHQRHELAR